MLNERFKMLLNSINWNENLHVDTVQGIICRKYWKLNEGILRIKLIFLKRAII